MADEIKLNIRLSLLNGSLKHTFEPGQISIDQATAGGPTPGFKTIGTSEETEAFAELTTDGYVIIQNLDTTNYIQVGFSTGVYGIRLKAGEVAAFRLEPTTTLYLKANTAACKVVIYAYED